MRSLYEITQDLEAELAAVSEDGEISEESWEKIEAGMSDMETKLPACALYVKHLEAEVAIIEGERKRLAERSAAISNRAKRMRQAILTAMKVAGAKKAGNELISISLSAGPPSVVVPEEADMKKLSEFRLPSSDGLFIAPVKATYSFDKTAIKKIITSHPKVAEEMGFSMKEGTESIRIK